MVGFNEAMPVHESNGVPTTGNDSHTDLEGAKVFLDAATPQPLTIVAKSDEETRAERQTLIDAARPQRVSNHEWLINGQRVAWTTPAKGVEVLSSRLVSYEANENDPQRLIQAAFVFMDIITTIGAIPSDGPVAEVMDLLLTEIEANACPW